MVESLGAWLEGASIAFVAIDAEGVVRAWNRGAGGMLGGGAGERVGRPFTGLLPARYDDARRAKFLRRLAGAAENEEVIEQSLVGEDGVERPIEIKVSRWRDGCALVLQDLTEQQALQDELLRLASFPALNPSPCVELDAETGAVVYANEAARAVGVDALVLGLFDEAREQGDLPEREREVGDRVWSLRVQRVDAWNRLRVYGQDVTDAVRARQELEERVAERTADLETANATMHLEVEERKRAERAALDASKAKSTFLANMSHELRTPLNAIIGYSELLLEEADATLAPDVVKIHGAARHLLDLISSILDLSKIEAGRMDLHLELVHPDAIVSDVASAVEPLVGKRNNRFVVESSNALPFVRTDVVKVRQILMNLLGNAAKFTEQGTVGLRVEAVGTEIRFTVWDTGIGMTREQASRLFEAFVQADSSTTRRFGGTGLGLAISREFARMLGGTVTVSSIPNEGTSFVVTLPIATEAPVAAAAAAATTAVPEGGGVTVLVIDDDLAVHELLQRMLEGEGFRVLAANRGEAGLALARSARPSAILLDVMMPERDGWSVLAALKGDPDLAAIPVVMLTMVDDRRRGVALGASEYFLKPVDRRALVTTLTRLTGGASGSVLVVEDDAATREFVRRALASEGWSVTEAGDGREALARLEVARPDVVVLDLMMPDVDGFEVVAQMRADPRFEQVPIVILTAMTLGSQELERLRGRVEALLLKGALGSDSLLPEIRAAVRRYGRHGSGT